QNNFFIRWNHLVDPRASLTDRFSASVNLGTSGNFTNNLNSSQNDYLSNTFQSNINWTHLWPGRPYNLSASMRHSQNTLNRTFDITLPAVTFNLQRIFPFQLLRPAAAPRRWYDQIGWNASVNFENLLSTTEERLREAELGELAEEMQNGIRLTTALNSSIKTKFFTLNPEVRLTNRTYFRSLEQTYDPETNIVTRDTVSGIRNVAEYSLGANMTSKLYGMYTFRGKNVQAIRLVITPNIGFN